MANEKLDGLLVISNSLKDYFINQGIKPNNVCVVNMFVDATRFERRDKTDDEKYIAYCGSVSSKKDGVDILIKSFAIFTKDIPIISCISLVVKVMTSRCLSSRIL